MVIGLRPDARRGVAPKWWLPIVAGLAAATVAGLRAYDAVRPLPPATHGDASRGEVALMHSDLGSKNYSSIPRAVYEALPVLFPEKFIEGWETFGVIPNPEDPNGPPIGSVRATVLGVESYATNCALCHAGLFRGKVVPGAPNFDLDVQRMTYAVNGALESDKLTVSAIADVSANNGRPLSIFDRMGIAAWLHFARDKVAKGRKNWFKDDLGTGRSDALNQWKRRLGIASDEHVTWVDIPPIFNQHLKTKTLFDGSITGDPAVRVMLTELQKGRPFREPLLHREVFDDLVAYVQEKLEPPRYPFPIDAGLAARGHDVFGQACATCHGTYGPEPRTYPNKRIDLATIGTDAERALSMTPDLKDALEKLEYKKFLTIDIAPTYMPPPLDGIWMTAPYLHNGSIPTLYHLLREPRARPMKFVRHANDYDPNRVGFVCDEQVGAGGIECGPDSKQKGHDPRVLWTFDATKKGNLNVGHTFGTKLPEEDKAALLEYLKTI